ncbi:hypothetical protein N7491_005935 [Penicillium cf. griseofulvum]|uniref:Uncharacterized protein n=1 Tax=Penicillium cf. griseofulvum TaxID=2972120 RepID=A0A9W9J415_9EURO|nr:hypothetical protein N7472_008617 [Penicillium cf. griseofulvum]KAJ5435340.1 hypothetical protein N7491_005935 [Penicillium cf. griseofulvum]KAJ5453171.1 hypothetical protein N7445_001354 [Penicillium cf. griseofulvum]
MHLAPTAIDARFTPTGHAPHPPATLNHLVMRPVDAAEDAMLSDAIPGPLHGWRKQSALATIGVNVTRAKHALSRQAAVDILALNQTKDAMVAVIQQDASVVSPTHVPPRRTAVIFQTTNRPEHAAPATAPQRAKQSPIHR